ncbi:Putative major facilitator superfamily, MFS transporter superfamily [Septoria linicola]|uniref:Major facilitator superfamily, MFS transporter superfamily n=1 Tax=Septoria linicola TaxID=215465 RepID=A0A9Q9B3T4_9PEZI|nr:Putative major facilitator superfamily, MFS transporter superfamily [Septoria linicola]
MAKDAARSTTVPVKDETATPKLAEKFGDESYKLFTKVQVDDPSPKEARLIRNKCVRWILPFLCIGYHLMYVDKQTLGHSSILGIMEDANLNSTQYNWLSSIFYLGYLLAEWPQNWALQHFPVAKWLALNFVIWGAILLLHIPCNSFASLFVVRFLLGVAEACIVPAFLLTLNMFFTYDEQSVLMPCMWAIDNSSPITSGLLSFSPWKWFFLITGILTVLFGTAVGLWLPNSPLDAHFLSLEEKAQAVLRIKQNHSGIEQKRFKRSQFIGAVKDPKTWLFFLHAWSQEMANGLTNQYSLIIKSFGFTTLQTTLLGCVNGVTAFVSLAAAAIILAKTTNCRAWLSVAAYIPPIISCILLLSLPWSNRWSHKEGYGLGNILSPQLFQPQYRPRYIPTWAVILGVACVFPMSLVLYLRWYLQSENSRRDKLQERGLVSEVGVVEHSSDGSVSEEIVDARQLDLTDRQNLAFRYVL